MSGGKTPVLRPLHDVLALWDGVIARWDLHSRERSLLLGAGFAGVIDDVEAYRVPDVEQRIRLLVELAPILAAVLCTDARVRTWLRLENSNLGGRSPIEKMGQSPEWIRWFVDSLGVLS